MNLKGVEDTGPSSIPFSGHSLYLSPRTGLDDPLPDVHCVVILLTEEEIAQSCGMDLCEHYRKNEIEAISYPIPDGSIPPDTRSFDALMQTIMDRLSRGNVLVHCSTGLGRTGTVAAGLLILDGETPETAMALVRRARRGCVETGKQEEFLRAYARSVIGAVPSR